MAQVVAIAGGTGFIGSACIKAMPQSWGVRLVPAPRFTTKARSLEGLRAEIDPEMAYQYAKQHLDGIDVLINAAGMATATSTDMAAMLGANALLPSFLASAAQFAAARRMVQVSSAAVQGRRVLDESENMQPQSRYGESKAYAEQLIRSETNVDIVRYRPTSVQGVGRGVTRSLMRLAQSPVAAIATPGDDPSPQTSVEQVARAVCLLADLDETTPSVVLHPWERTTTRSVLNDLGGREPRAINRAVATRVVSAGYATARVSPHIRGHVRRLDMMLFGQPQVSGWLETRLARLDDDWLKSIRQELVSAEKPRL